MNSRPAIARRSMPQVRRNDARAVMARLAQDIEATRHAIARSKASAILHSARGLVTELCSIRVRVELAHAAAAFAEGLDERTEAEEWVLLAVRARATLQHAARSGAAELAEELAELDAAFEDARDAVLLLEPEDYKEALAGTPPDLRAWWGERARLDRVREIDLERALGLLRT